MKLPEHYINVIKNKIVRLINQRRGWVTDRKIVVIESDDWGSIRMPDRKVYDKSLKRGINVNESYYNKYDTLASIDDFEHLFTVLSKHKDKNNNFPIITANVLTANPDFDKIRECQFQEYHYEPFTETLKKYPNRSFDLWKEGINNNMFFPQLHGREHLNVARWMKFLQKPSAEVHFMFDNKMWGFGPLISLEKNPSFVQAFDSIDYLANHSAKSILTDACIMFEDIFGFKSKSFIAPNYIWNSEIEIILNENGVKYLQGSFFQYTQINGVKYNYLGKTNELGQIYLTRNVIFEPSSNRKIDWINNALSEIETAFNLKKPAVITMHRVSFVGGIFEENRILNLKMFDELLKQIIKKWPNVEFMHSAELGSIINKN